MNSEYQFNLADFAIGEDEGGQDSIPVLIPKTAFRIHPDKARTTRVYLTRFDDKNWWLVDRDVKRQVRVPKLWVADLFHGVFEDGTNFIVPLTHPREGYEGYYHTLKKAIERARTTWCKIEKVAEEKTYHLQTNGKLWAEPGWLDGDWPDFIEVAFEGHTITTVEQAESLFTIPSRRRIPEESMD